MRISRVSAVYGMAAIAVAISGWLLFGAITVEGLSVPVRLTELVDVAEAAGEAYQPPADVVTVCREADSVPGSVRDEIRLVTGVEEPQSCQFGTDSWSRDTFLAIAGVVLVIILVGLAYGLSQSEERWPVWVVVLFGAVAFVLGAWFGREIWDVLSQSPVKEGVRFWRSLGAIFVIVVGFVLAFLADEQISED